MRAPAPPRASRSSTRSPCRELVGVAHGVAAGVEHDRVAALERRLRARAARSRWPRRCLAALGALDERARGSRRAARRRSASASRREIDPESALRSARAGRRAPRGRSRRAHDARARRTAGARAQALDVLELLAVRRARSGARRPSASRRGGRRRDRRAARRARARPPRRRRVEQAAIARQSASSENGSRSSSEPPPRVITITSTSGSRVERAPARQDPGHGALALHGGLGQHEARRRGARARALRHDVERRRGVAPADQADAARPERQRPLAPARRSSPSASSRRRASSMRASSAPSPAGSMRVGAQRQLGALVVERRPCRAPARAGPRPAAGRGARRPSGPSSPQSERPRRGRAA